MKKNYEVSKTGFIVKDTETNHVLTVSFRNDKYQGVVIMPEQKEELSFSPWKKGENPFNDDYCFEGTQEGFAPDGLWWFSVSPTSPFSAILKEVEELNRKTGFFKKINQKKEKKLSDVVSQTHRSSLVLDAINGDLGNAADDIGKSSKEIIMAYGYARRAAIAGLYVQGHTDKSTYDYVRSIFKSLQQKTGHSIDFQEQAFSDSIEFMQQYNHMMTSFFVKKMVSIAENYEIPPGQMNDAQLIKRVVELAYDEEQENS